MRTPVRSSDHGVVSDAERDEAAFWAAFLRNRNVDAGTAADGAVAVAGGYALCVAGTALTYAIGAGSTRPLRGDDFAVVEEFYGSRGLGATFELSAGALSDAAPWLHDRAYADDGVVLHVYEGAVARVEAPGEVAVRTTTDRRTFGDLLIRAAAEQVHDVGVLHRSASLNAAAAAALVIAAIDGVDVGVGAIGVAGDRALFFSGAVLPAYRGRGVHGALLAARMNLAYDRGVGGVALKIAAGSPAEKSAARFGFVKTGERRRMARPRA